jgi:hypothetical protein
MTRADFLDELRTIQPAFKWFLRKDGAIRATPNAGDDKRLFNLVTAVVYAKTGEFFPEDVWSEPASALGISIEDCAYFLSACSFAWDPSTRQSAARKEILEIVKIGTAANQADSLTDRVKSDCRGLLDNFR